MVFRPSFVQFTMYLVGFNQLTISHIVLFVHKILSRSMYCSENIWSPTDNLRTITNRCKSQHQSYIEHYKCYSKARTGHLFTSRLFHFRIVPLKVYQIVKSRKTRANTQCCSARPATIRRAFFLLVNNTQMLSDQVARCVQLGFVQSPVL